MTALLEADLALLVELDMLGEYLDELGPPHFADGHLKDTLDTLDNRIEAVSVSYRRRHEHARGLGDESNA